MLTTHLTIPAGSAREEVAGAKQAVRDLLDAHAFEHVTVEVELEGERQGHRGTRRADESGADVVPEPHAR